MAARILWLSRRGGHRHQRLHQRSGGGSFGTFACVANPSPLRGPKVALQSTHDLRSLVVRMPGLRGRASEGPKLAIAGVSQAGHDVAALVQLTVDGGDVDVDVGMRARKSGDSLWRRDQAHLLD